MTVKFAILRPVAVVLCLTGCQANALVTNLASDRTVETAVSPPAAAGVAPSTDSPLDGEILNGNGPATVSNVLCQQAYSSTNFSATGVALGPYPGTFSVSGNWQHDGQANRMWEFFTIVSGKSTLSGAITAGGRGFQKLGLGCYNFGPESHLFWDARDWSGRAASQIISSSHHFNQKLH